eukprot:13697172-Alexandrium_andersonii.AAC.1
MASWARLSQRLPGPASNAPPPSRPRLHCHRMTSAPLGGCSKGSGCCTAPGLRWQAELATPPELAPTGPRPRYPEEAAMLTLQAPALPTAAQAAPQARLRRVPRLRSLA